MDKKDKITTKDIATRLGVSTTTVHRAIYGKKGVSEELRQKIMKEVEATNYVIDEMASLLRRDEINIAVVLPRPVGEDQYFFRGIWTGICDAEGELKNQKFKVQHVENDLGIYGMSEALEALFDRTDSSLQGLITMCDDDKSAGWINRFSKRGTQVVLVSNSEEGGEALCSLKASHKDRGALAAHFINILLAGTKGSVLGINEDRAVFSSKHYLQSLQKRLAENLMYTQISGLDGREYGEKLRNILSESIPDVLFCGSARVTYNVCNIVNNMGLSGKLKIVGTDVFDEITPFFEDGTMLASVYQSNREQGKMALNILSKKLSGLRTENESQIIDMPIGLVFKENYRFYTS